MCRFHLLNDYCRITCCKISISKIILVCNYIYHQYILYIAVLQIILKYRGEILYQKNKFRRYFVMRFRHFYQTTTKHSIIVQSSRERESQFRDNFVGLARLRQIGKNFSLAPLARCQGFIMSRDMIYDFLPCLFRSPISLPPISFHFPPYTACASYILSTSSAGFADL